MPIMNLAFGPFSLKKCPSQRKRSWNQAVIIVVKTSPHTNIELFPIALLGNVKK